MSSISNTTSNSYMNTLNQFLPSSLSAKAVENLTPTQKLTVEIQQMGLDAFTSSDTTSSDPLSDMNSLYNPSATTSTSTTTSNSKGQSTASLRQELQQMGASASLSSTNSSDGESSNGNMSNALLDIIA